MHRIWRVWNERRRVTFSIGKYFYKLIFNNNNNNIYLLQLGCYPVAVVILHVNKT